MKTFKKKLKALFYKADENAIFYILEENISPITYRFLRTYHRGQNPTITPTQFKAKITPNTQAYTTKSCETPILLSKLLGQITEFQVAIKHYYFQKNGQNIFGWNMELLEIYPVN